MPLLHRDSSRGGGSQENRRSLAEILNFDPSEFADNPAAPKENRANDGDEAHWPYWQQPGSPQVAQSPRALVPTACFPPQESPATYGSYSELAMPGNWAKESEGSIVDLVGSLKTLATPQQSTRRTRSYQTRLSCELKIESSWPPESTSQPPEENRDLQRRASFCGAADGQRARLLSWCGVLPTRGLDANPPGGFSAKVFMGGLPWDITEEALMYALREFIPVRVEWPGNEAAPRGFAYVTLESERRVRALLHASRRDHGKWIYRITSRNLRTKDAEVIPWAVSDSNWVCASLGAGGGAGSVRLEPTRTVFVGALHGVLSASALATIMNELFSGVVYAGIDTDKNKYPIGSGRVTFSNVHSYVRAVSAAYVEIRTDKFTKKIQVDPYLEDSMCSVCNLQQGPYFCRDPVCFRYFCRSCWAWKHATEDHKALMRNSKSTTFVANCNGNGNFSNGNGGNGNSNGNGNGIGNGSNYHGANCNGSNYHGANCNGSNYHGANCNGSNYHGANCNGSNYHGANCNGSNYHSANCNGSYIQANATPSSSSASGGSGSGDEPLAVEWLSLV